MNHFIENHSRPKTGSLLTSALLSLSIAWLTGCGHEQEKETRPPREPTEERELTPLREAVEGATGIGAIRTGERIKDQIRQIEETRRNQYDRLDPEPEAGEEPD